MAILDPLFGSPEMDRVFSDSSRVQSILDFEAALAAAEARVGVIPQAAAPAIAKQCQATHFSLEDLARKATSAGNLAIPLVKRLTELVAQQDQEAARYVHWGATSQDAIDTGLVLQIREALNLLDAGLTRACAQLVTLVERHRKTPLVARTWMQHAVPTLFGLKLAGWLDALLRHRTRLREGQKRALALQFGGAAGTLATLGDKGLAVSQALGEELRLPLPALPWHSHRDRMAELGTMLALLVGSLGKIARDISLQMQTEVAELAEPAGDGRGGSSTMPHKRNPVACSAILAAAARTPGLAGTMLSVLPQEYERGLGGWQAEWETLPEIFRLTAGALARTEELLQGLEVHPDAMTRNLDATHGLIFAEAVMMALAAHVGKPEAHRITEAASQRALASGKHFRDVLLADQTITTHLKPEQIHQLFNPLSYTGVASQFMDRVLAESALALKASGS
jgi:3-carboxy-cis,cis-muconate cycloisomerase